MKLQNERYYDKFSTMYEDERAKRYHRFLDASEIEAARPYCEGKETLEVGCGTGLVLHPITVLAKCAMGLDISHGMLEKARDRGLKVLRASGTDIPFADGSFDCVVSFKVLAHIEQIEQTLAECGRVLRPGGHLVLEFYNKHSIRHMVKQLKPAQKVATDATDDQVYTRYDSLTDIKSYLPEGFNVVKTIGIRCLAPTYHFFNAPVLGAATEAVEKLLQRTLVGRIGGFLVVVAQKQ